MSLSMVKSHFPNRLLLLSVLHFVLLLLLSFYIFFRVSHILGVWTVNFFFKNKFKIQRLKHCYILFSKKFFSVAWKALFWPNKTKNPHRHKRKHNLLVKKETYSFVVLLVWAAAARKMSSTFDFDFFSIQVSSSSHISSLFIFFFNAYKLKYFFRCCVFFADACSEGAR